jgi:hypothetical protein
MTVECSRETEACRMILVTVREDDAVMPEPLVMRAAVAA